MSLCLLKEELRGFDLGKASTSAPPNIGRRQLYIASTPPGSPTQRPMAWQDFEAAGWPGLPALLPRLMSSSEASLASVQPASSDELSLKCSERLKGSWDWDFEEDGFDPPVRVLLRDVTTLFNSIPVAAFRTDDCWTCGEWGDHYYFTRLFQHSSSNKRVCSICADAMIKVATYCCCWTMPTYSVVLTSTKR